MLLAGCHSLIQLDKFMLCEDLFPKTLQNQAEWAKRSVTACRLA